MTSNSLYTDLPDGVSIINLYVGVFRYEEPGTPQDDPRFVDFAVYRDGLVEIASAGAPSVPVDVLGWLVSVVADRRAG